MTTGTFKDEWGYYTAIPELVTEMIPQIGANAYTLFCYLRYRTNKKRGYAWPGYDRMKVDLKWGDRRISEAIKTLKAAGLLRTSRPFGGTTHYWLTVPDSSRDSQDSRNGSIDAKTREMEVQHSRNGSESLTEVNQTHTGGRGGVGNHKIFKKLCDFGIWESDARLFAVYFSEDEIEVAIARTKKRSGWDQEEQAGYLAKMLKRWSESSEDRTREFAANRYLTYDPNQEDD